MDNWISADKPPHNFRAVNVAAQIGTKLIVCSDTAYYNNEKRKWFDHSNDLQLVDGFIKFWQELPSPPTKSK